MSPSVDVGCGSRKDPTATWGLDRHAGPSVDVVGCVLALPFRSGSLDALTAHQVVEHLPVDGVGGRDAFFAFFDEAWRVLKPGGVLVLDVPHASSHAAFGDPTHRRFLTPETFSHLWDVTRDPSYPRRRWELVALWTRASYDTFSHLDRRHPVLDAVLRWLVEHSGRRDVIHLRLQKPWPEPEACPECVGGETEDGDVCLTCGGEGEA